MIPPVVRRRVIEPLWARYARTPRLARWRELEASQFLPVEVLRERQAARLQALVRQAARHSPFYARRFAQARVDPAAIRTAGDLGLLPVLTKRDVREHLHDMRSTALEGTPLLEFRTGGSTGTPLRIFITDELSETRNAAARRSDRWSGWEVGEAVGAVWGNPRRPSSLKERLRHELLEPVVFLDTMAVTPDAVRAFAAAFRRARATLLFGHAHSLYLLACLLRDEGIEGIEPRALISTSMMLLASERAVIEHVFGVKVFDRYGCEEVGLIACECERHAGLHINLDHLVVEFLREDGSASPAGEMAYVVVTDLLNDAMPFIRYRVEDMACWRAEPCGCGRGLPLMDRVAGRVADFLLRRDGARVAGVSLIENTLTKFEGLAQMQIVQDALDRIIVRVVPGPGFSSETARHLTDYFSTIFPGAGIVIEETRAIAREPNGKYRFSICKVAS